MVVAEDSSSPLVSQLSWSPLPHAQCPLQQGSRSLTVCSWSIEALYIEPDLSYPVGTMQSGFIGLGATSQDDVPLQYGNQVPCCAGIFTHVRPVITGPAGLRVEGVPVEVAQRVPAVDTPTIVVNQWLVSGTGTVTYEVYLDLGRRLSLKNGPCEVICPRWRFYGATATGYSELLQEVDGTSSSSRAAGFAEREVRRVWGEVQGGGQWYRTPVVAVDPSRRVSTGVDAAAAGLILAPVLLGLSAFEICLPLNTFTRAPLDGTVTRAAVACEQMLTAGGSVSSALGQLAARYGPAAVAVLIGAHLAAAATVDAPPTRSDAPPRTPTDGTAEVPYRAGDLYQPRIQKLADLFTGRKLTPIGRALTRGELEHLARQCFARAVASNADGREQCDSTPIFFTGSSTPEATKHDAEAMATHPEWALATKGRSPTWTDKWYNAVPPCLNGVRPAGKDCDEFPFGTTQAGGPESPSKPGASLKLITGTDNRYQGSLAESFYRGCRVTEGGTFYVVPLVGVASLPAPPTTGVCA